MFAAFLQLLGLLLLVVAGVLTSPAAAVAAFGVAAIYVGLAVERE